MFAAPNVLWPLGYAKASLAQKYQSLTIINFNETKIQKIYIKVLKMDYMKDEKRTKNE